MSNPSGWTAEAGAQPPPKAKSPIGPPPYWRACSPNQEKRMKYYLCKYIPPRADFLATMTADEKDWMKQHGAFLDDLLNKGLIVAHGPVMDPSGGYGVSLYQIADDQDIAALTLEDPIVKNGAGHYEHHPMLHLKARG
jgi:uncharacterized protein YciI